MSALLVILALFFQILMPGWAVMRCFRRGVSLSDAFAAGVLIATTTFLFFSVFFDRIDFISFAYRITLVGVTIISFFRLLSERKSGRYWRSEIALSFCRFPVLLSSITILGVCLFVVTHNVGFDDVAIARTIWPTLTTIAQPYDAMSRAAVNYFAAREAGENDRPDADVVTLDYEFKIRNSTAAPG